MTKYARMQVCKYAAGINPVQGTSPRKGGEGVPPNKKEDPRQENWQAWSDHGELCQRGPQ